MGQILMTEGSSDLTFARVAREAGVSKTTLYKWWPSRGALAADGYFHAVEATLAFGDTGDIRADVLAQLRNFAAVMTDTTGRVLLELIGQAQTDVDLGQALSKAYTAERRRLAGERLTAAQTSGQIRGDVDVRVLVDQLWGAVYHRLLLPDEPVDDAFLSALVANLMDGVATPAPVPQDTAGRSA